MRGSPVPPTILFQLFSRYRGALEVGGVLSLLGWALPQKAPPSGHKRPLATHMRGPPLAAARLPQPVRGTSSPQGIDRSHTCSVRDILNCVSKGGAAQPAGGFYVQYVPPPYS